MVGCDEHVLARQCRLRVGAGEVHCAPIARRGVAPRILSREREGEALALAVAAVGPAMTSEAAVPGATTMLPCVPVMELVSVSVSVTDCVPTLFRVTAENTWLPAS